MTNTVAQITNSVSPINGLDVVNAVNGFYSGAFTNIAWLLGILVTLFGIAVGAIYYLIQNLQLKLQKEKLEKKFTADFEELKTNLREENQRIIDGLGKKLKAEVQHAKAGICLVQGHFYLEKGNKKDALESYFLTIRYFSQTTDFKQLQGTLQYVTGILADFSKSHISSEAIKRYEIAMESIGKIESKGLLDIDIEKIKKALAEAQKRG
jgi:hypothetical protein